MNSTRCATPLPHATLDVACGHVLDEGPVEAGFVLEIVALRAIDAGSRRVLWAFVD